MVYGIITRLFFNCNCLSVDLSNFLAADEKCGSITWVKIFLAMCLFGWEFWRLMLWRRKKWRGKTMESELSYEWKKKYQVANYEKKKVFLAHFPMKTTLVGPICLSDRSSYSFSLEAGRNFEFFASDFWYRVEVSKRIRFQKSYFLAAESTKKDCKPYISIKEIGLVDSVA